MWSRIGTIINARYLAKFISKDILNHYFFANFKPRITKNDKIIKITISCYKQSSICLKLSGIYDKIFELFNLIFQPDLIIAKLSNSKNRL
jgi:hypothetical protein